MTDQPDLAIKVQQLLASSAVERRIAASAHVIGPIASFFWHMGDLSEGEERRVVFNTAADRYPDLEAHLLTEHS